MVGNHDNNHKKRQRDLDGESSKDDVVLIQQQESHKRIKKSSELSADSCSARDDSAPLQPEDPGITRKTWSDENIPNAAHYHISWMHAECITHVVHNSKHGYVVSGR